MPKRFKEILTKVKQAGYKGSSAYAVSQWLYSKKYGHTLNLHKYDKRK